MFPELTAAEATDLADVVEGLKHLKKQYWVLATRNKPPMASPAQLISEGKWANFALLKDAALARARHLVSALPHVLVASPPKSAAQLHLAFKLSAMVAPLLLTCLPPQRARSLYEMRLFGAVGVDDASTACLDPQCTIPGCRGIRLTRHGPRSFTYIVDHHKNRSKSKRIPEQPLSEEHRIEPTLLDVLEQVRCLRLTPVACALDVRRFPHHHAPCCPSGLLMGTFTMRGECGPSPHPVRQLRLPWPRRCSHQHRKSHGHNGQSRVHQAAGAGGDAMRAVDLQHAAPHVHRACPRQRLVSAGGARRVRCDGQLPSQVG
jgi:hypothetical protein